MPEALVVPPTVSRQSNYAWGVGGFRVDRVGAQYQYEAGTGIGLQPAQLSARAAATERHAAVRRVLRPRATAVIKPCIEP